MRVSVYITSYNQKELLQEAIESVLNQTRMPDEVVIADDCSTDGSQELIREYAASHSDLVRPIFQERNVGIPQNRNAAIRATSGDLVTYLDGDDRYLPNKIAVDLETFESNPDVDIVCSNVLYVDSEGARTGKWCENGDDVPTGSVTAEVLGRMFPKSTLFRNEMVRREELERVGFYDTSLPLYEDWELRIRLVQSCKLAYSEEPTIEYRKHSSGISTSHRGRHLDACTRIYQKHRSLIESFSPDTRRKINSSIRPWIGEFAWKAFSQAAVHKDYASAWAYLVDAIKYAPRHMDVKKIAKLFTPKSVIEAYRRAQN